jgi:alkaline phosphatase D
MGAQQERWLADGLSSSTADGVRWQVLCQQVLMGSRHYSTELANFLPQPQNDAARSRTELALATAKAGLPLNLDTWDGYPSARSRVLGSAQEAEANLVVLSGDSHNSWAFELDNGAEAAGVEFGGTSVTSPGAEATFSGDPMGVARAFAAGSSQIRWAETSRRGYFTVEMTPERAMAEFVFMDTVRQPSMAVASRHQMSVVRGTNRFAG